MNGIVMLVNEFPPLPIGGAERQAERLSQFLAGHGWNIRVLTRGADGLAARQKQDGYQILRVRPFGPGKMKSLTFVIGAMRTLWQERSQYQILHAHLAFGPAFAAALVGRILGKSVIVKLGNSGPFGDIQSSQKTWRGRLRLYVLRHWVNAIIALDSKMQAEALAAGFTKAQIRRLPNGIDKTIYDECRDKKAAKAALGLEPGFTLLFIGRLSKQKSLDTLISAFSNARKETSAIQLVIVGDGPERQNLEKSVHDLGLMGSIRFAGMQTDVLPYLAAADIFVLPSSSEGISNALLEAMACGLACIATDVGGTPDVLQQAGVLIEPGQPDQLAQKILALTGNPTEIARLGHLARQRILEEYDVELVGSRYIQLYQDLLNAQSTRLDQRAAV